MTFQPPPPPGGNPPPPPPPGQWGPPPGGGYPAPQGGFNASAVNPLDWAILGCGLLAFIFSFVSYYTYENTNCGQFCVSVSTSAWSGFFGWFAMLLAVIGSVLVGLELFAPQVKLPIANRLAGLGAYALATLCVILALFVVPDYLGITSSGIDSGHGFGYWVSLIVIAAGLVVSLMRLQQTGGKLPGALGNMPNIGGQAPHGGIGSGPAPGGYGPPPGPAPGPAPGQGGYPPAPGPGPMPGPGQPPPPGYGPPPGP